MKQADIIIGFVYTAKISGQIVPLEIINIQRIEHYDGSRQRIRYVCKNLNTSRQVNVKSATKFRERYH